MNRLLWQYTLKGSDKLCVTLTNVDAHFDQGWQVGAVKGIEVDGVDLGGAVAAVELIAKVQTDLGDDKVACDGEGTQEVVDGIVPDLCDGYLRACDDDSFAEKEKEGIRKDWVGYQSVSSVAMMCGYVGNAA